MECLVEFLCSGGLPATGRHARTGIIGTSGAGLDAGRAARDAYAKNARISAAVSSGRSSGM
jgi:hypothetical protein